MNLSTADLSAAIGDLQKPLKHSANNSTCDPINVVIGQHPLFSPELVNISVASSAILVAISPSASSATASVISSTKFCRARFHICFRLPRLHKARIGPS